MWTIFQMLIEWTVVRYVQSFDKQYSQIRKHHIRNLKFQLKQIKFKRYHIYYRPCLDTRLSQSPVTNACFGGFFPPASLLFLPSTREGRGGGRGKDSRSSADVTSDCAGCVALGTQSLAPLLSCVCVCVFSVSLILLFPKEGVLWTKHTRNVRATVPESIVVTWCWQIKSWDEIMASQQTDCYGPVVTHCQNAEVWCSFRLTAEVKHKSASPCRDLLTSHQQCKYVNSAIPLGWRALKTPTAQTPGFCGHVTPLTLHYLWPRPPGVWLGGPGCKPGHSRGP